MIPVLIGLALAVLFVVWRLRRKADPPGPLAGYDTGVRSPYRTPARRFHNRRTL